MVKDNTKKVVVIGAGFAGLTAAALLAQQGYQVTLVEKHDQAGGRARVWKTEGFHFDMGPSWYWMPEVFEEYFALFGKKVSDFYQLERLDPGYRVFFGKDDYIDVPANMEDLEALFESLEPGSSKGLKEFLAQAAYKYEVGMSDYVFRPSHSLMEYMDLRLLIESFRIQMFQSLSKHVRQYFTNPKLIKLLEFPVLFLGATPEKTPAMYSMMNHADLTLGTWYPKGGMNEIVKAMVSIAESQGVDIRLEHEVKSIEVSNGKAKKVITSQGELEADAVVAGSDYEHTDQSLLSPENRHYTPKYWDKRTMSPSSLLFYIGLNKKLTGIKHHTLFFDEDFKLHAEEIYTDPKWPSKPLFYVSSTSQSDPIAAPEGHENLFFLMPLAPGLTDSEEMREKYYHVMMERYEQLIGQSVRDAVIVKRSYAMEDFKKDYNSFKGNAYGLANTITQTAFLKPKMRSKKVENLYYTGQLTVPGPGVPPSLISGQVVAKEVGKYLSKK